MTDSDISQMDPIKYQKPKSLVETVTDYLRESIVNGTLKPGQRLNNKDIMASLGVSNIPLREAIRILEQEGLICSRSGRGYWITSISRKDLLETFEMREMMEVFGITLLERRAALNGQVRFELEGIREAEMSQGPHSEESRNFHVQLLELTLNQRLIGSYTLLSNSVLRYQKMSYELRHHNRKRENEHTPIILALCEGRFDDAKSEIRKHLGELQTELLQHLNSRLDDGDKNQK